MLLSTKLITPPNSEFVIPRQTLFDRLDRAVAGKLTLVTAPAGYGKTTLVAKWLDQQAADLQQAAWLLLDESDNEPVRFIRYFIAALQHLAPGAGATIQEALQADHVTPLAQTIEEMVTVLINDLAHINGRVLLVVDDFHLIYDKQIVSGIRYWIEHAPATIHTILISRDASMLPVARWRVRRQCVELVASDLRFSTAEAAAFVRQMLRLDLDDEQIVQLTERTEGWIAGLQLAALSLQSSDNPANLIKRFTGNDRYVVDYLIEEVLHKQPEDLRNFLLQTSILKQLSADLCDKVLGLQNSRGLLEQMEKRNLFLVPLDNQRHWYRYHPLFAEALQTQLYAARTIDPAELHRRAYAWYSTHDLGEEAIEHALAAKLYPQAAESLAIHSQAILWQQSRPQAFLRWCNQLPKDVIYHLPALAIAYGWAQILTGHFGDLSHITQDMRAAWSEAHIDTALPSPIRNELALLEAEVAVNVGRLSQVMQLLARIDREDAMLHPATEAIFHQLSGYAYRLEGNIAAAQEALQAAVHLTEPLGNSALWIFAHADLAETHTMAGELSIAAALYQKVLHRFPPDQYRTYSALAFVHLSLARVQYLGNRLTDATDSVQRGLGLSMPNPWITQYGLVIQGEIEQVKGNWPAVEAIIQRLGHISRDPLGSRQRAYIDSFIARHYLLRGDAQQASLWATDYRRYIDLIPRYQLHQMDVTWARYQVAVDPAAAVETLAALRVTAYSERWRESLIEIDVLLALAHQTLANFQAARQAFGDALSLAEADGILAPFLIEGVRIMPLLRALATHDHHQAFVGQLQASFLPAFVPSSQPFAQPLAEPLTKRELDVLKMMANGLSNPEIADALILATGTVAKHTNNIFGKLGVRNRTEASQRAQALGLL